MRLWQKWQKWNGLFGIGVLALVLLTWLLWGRASSLVSQQDQPKLELTIASSDLRGEKKQFLLGEPIRLQLALRNISQDPQTGTFYLEFGTNTLHVFIAKGESTFALYMPKSLKIAQRQDIVLSPITLQPQEKREVVEFVSFDVNSDDFALPTAGRYRLKALHFFAIPDLNKAVESNVIEVEVVEPEGKDKEALQFIVDNKFKPFLTPEAGLFRVENETVVQLKAFVEEKFPDSTYAPYVKLGLEAICKTQRERLPACQK